MRLRRFVCLRKTRAKSIDTDGTYERGQSCVLEGKFFLFFFKQGVVAVRWRKHWKAYDFLRVVSLFSSLVT